MPINKIYGYENFTSNSLYPFSYSKEIYSLVQKDTLRLIEEVETDNPLFGDIFKVEIISGYYKGKICFVYEESIKLNITNDKQIYVVFKRDDQSLNRDFIKKDSKFTIKDTRIEDNVEIYTLQDSNNNTFDFINKSSIRFLINKTDEINFALKNNKIVIKVVNNRNLFPIENVWCDNNVSDKDGIIISEKRSILLKRSGFADALIQINPDQNIYLCFMEELNKTAAETGSIYKDELIDIYTSQLSKDKINISLFNNSFSILSLPDLNRTNFIIKKVFYIDAADTNTNLQCNIQSLFHPIEILYFDKSDLTWKSSKIEDYGSFMKFNIYLSTFYCILSYKESNLKKIDITKNFQTSTPQIINKERDWFTNKGIIPDTETELVCFSPYAPYTLYQSIIKINSEKVEINIIPNNTECTTFNYLYYGQWDRIGIKEDNKIIDSDKTKLEYLATKMELINDNKITFKNNDLQIEGLFELLDKDRLQIRIKYINLPVKLKEFGTYNITPSLFDSEVIIPSFYSFYAGNLQISLTNIYFSRKTSAVERPDTNLLIENPLFYKITYPENENSCKYKIYFFKNLLD